MIVKNIHKCHKHHAILHKLCTLFGKNELRLYLKELKNFRLGGGGGPAAPSKYAHGNVAKYQFKIELFSVEFDRWHAASREQ